MIEASDVKNIVKPSGMKNPFRTHKGIKINQIQPTMIAKLQRAE